MLKYLEHAGIYRLCYMLSTECEQMKAKLESEKAAEMLQT